MAVKEKTFDCIEFKRQAQARVQKEYAGLSPEETCKRLSKDVENGPLGDFWRRISKRQDTERSS